MKLIIEIRGGCLAAVYSDFRSQIPNGTEVMVIDWDVEGSPENLDEETGQLRPSIWEENVVPITDLPEDTKEALDAS